MYSHDENKTSLTTTSLLEPLFSKPVFVLGFPALLYLLFGSFGYGTDFDTYGMLSTWKIFLETHSYSLSRSPGYPIPEFLIGLASYCGGYPLSNALTAGFSLLCLWCFNMLVLPFFGKARSGALTLFIGINPYWIIAASSSMDYMYSLGFALLGIRVMLANKPLASASLFAFAAASRLTIAPVLGLALLLYGYHSKAWYRATVSIMIFTVMTIVCYLPSWFASGQEMFLVVNGGMVGSFFRLDSGNFTFFSILSRVVYKNLMLLGILPLILIMTFLLKHRYSPKISNVSILCVGISLSFIYYELLFFRLPHDIAYLLPVLLMITIVIGFVLPSIPIMSLLVLLTLLNSFITLDPLKIDYNVKTREQIEAGSARIKPHFCIGAILNDIRNRKAAQAYFLPKFGIHHGKTLFLVNRAMADTTNQM